MLSNMFSELNLAAEQCPDIGEDTDMGFDAWLMIDDSTLSDAVRTALAETGYSELIDGKWIIKAPGTIKESLHAQERACVAFIDAIGNYDLSVEDRFDIHLTYLPS